MAGSKSFKSKVKTIENAPADGNTKNVEIIVPLKYLSNFWRTLKMLLINFEVNIILRWSLTCVIINPASAGRLAVTDANLYVPVVTLSAQDNTASAIKIWF